MRAKDYTTALRFDQLRDVLASPGGCFDGFTEGDITFPPTYKYDCAKEKGGRKKRGTLMRLAGAGRAHDKARERAATDPEVPSAALTPPPPLGGGGGTTDGATTATEDDTLSIVSSAGTISTMDTTLDSALDTPQAVAAREDLAALGMPMPPMKGDEAGVEAARKAQVRFLTLVKRNSNVAALEYARRARDASEGSTGGGARPRRGTLSALFPPRPILRTSQSAVVVPTTKIPAGVEESDEPEPDPEVKATDEEAEAAEPVFDTSKKQRVQSWTGALPSHSAVPRSPSLIVDRSRRPHPLSHAHPASRANVARLGAFAAHPPTRRQPAEERALAPPTPRLGRRVAAPPVPHHFGRHAREIAKRRRDDVDLAAGQIAGVRPSRLGHLASCSVNSAPAPATSQKVHPVGLWVIVGRRPLAPSEPGGTCRATAIAALGVGPARPRRPTATACSRS